MKTLSFIIPVYNEQERINKTFEALKTVSLSRGLKLKEVIFVNDGSTDNTKLKIQNSKLKERFLIKLLTYAQNKGKGYATRQGMLHATGDYALIFDADMSTPLSEIAKFKPFMDKDIDVIVGTRKNGHSTVIEHQPLYREILGHGFTKLTQIILGINNTDFTCGFKAFSQKAKDTIFRDAMINGWGYDAEILFLAHKYGFTQQEVAVVWANDARTRVKLFSAVTKTLTELSQIVYSHRVRPTLISYKSIPSSLLTKLNLLK